VALGEVSCGNIGTRRG